MTTSKPAILIIAACVAAAVFASTPVFAQRTGGQTGVQYNEDGTIDDKPVPITTEIIIPGTPVTPGPEPAGTLVDLAQYIGIIYNFLIAIIGMVAAVMFVIGGFQYVASAGDSGKIGAAKTRIMNALIGMVLALGAYTLLNTINPAMLTLKVPGGISGVRTEITFLPFCDKLAAQYKITEDQITKASGYRKGIYDPSPVFDTLCGTAGFIKSKIRNSDGTLKDSRIWCVWRGDKTYTAQKRAHGEKYIADYGCEDDTSISGERVIGADLEVHTLAVCIPRGGITQAQLNEEYDKSAAAAPEGSVPYISTKLAECQACNTISDGLAARILWPTGDQSCQFWQNTANNGDPKDYNFKISKKGIIQDSRVVDSDNRSHRMYYCGYSANYGKCIYAPVNCDRVGECDNYDKVTMHYCEPSDSNAIITCHASQTLGSKWGTQAGNAAHLIPVCESDPCEKGPRGCTVPGLAGARNSLVGGAASKVRVVARVLTGGLTNSITCDAK